jgi:ADP-heptose:LPS heptosyltransferase
LHTTKGIIPYKMLEADKILVIQLRQIGDVLLTTPVLRVLRKYYPKSHIAFLTEKASAPLLVDNPCLDQVIIRNRQSSWREELALIRQIHQQRYDLVLDFFRNPRSGWITFFSDARHRVASYHPLRTFFYTITPKIQSGEGYAVLDKLALLKAIGLEGDLTPPHLEVPEDAKVYIKKFLSAQEISERDSIITISPTGRREHRKWTPEGYARLADRLTETYNARVIFLWGPGEKNEVSAILEKCSHSHILACPTDLLQMAALLDRSRLHIGNDSAPRHIAAAMGTPTLTIIGPTNEVHWTYPSPIHRVVYEPIFCRPCEKKTCAYQMECMKDLAVEKVEKVSRYLLREVWNYSEPN